MQLFIFVITYPFIWLLSKMPMKILHIKSDILSFLMHNVFKYRKDVVLKNLGLAFPEKNLKEKKVITKNFFKHFTDLFIETIKGISISEKEILSRYKFKNPELLTHYLNSGKSIALVGSHQANWEWSVCLPLLIKHKVSGAYTSLGNSYFDKIVKDTREKFGFFCYKSSNTVKAIHKDYSKNIRGVYLLLSDQSPQLSKTVYWQQFFNVKVPVYNGAEALAKRYDLVVINMATTKTKRGYYESEFQLITDTPKEADEHYITDTYLELTEQTVKSQPECYLWSHNRFKHQHRYEEWKQLKISKSKKRK